MGDIKKVEKIVDFKVGDKVEVSNIGVRWIPGEVEKVHPQITVKTKYLSACTWKHIRPKFEVGNKIRDNNSLNPPSKFEKNKMSDNKTSSYMKKTSNKYRNSKTELS